MKREYHRWYSSRLGFELGVVAYGHYGSPIIGFPTSAGDEFELEGQGMIGALAEFIDAGRVKFYSVNSINGLSFYNKAAHPFHRSYIQSVFDSYLREEVVPFIWNHCQSQVAIATMGASFGAYHAANSLFKHPDVFKRCFAMSGVYDLRKFMDGMYDNNFYFNNPVDYLGNLSDPWIYDQLASCDVHLITGIGPWEHSGPTYHFSGILRNKGIRHSLDNWGPQGGHDWPYWKAEMREYISRLY
jgi:esterase/lipase superfamily enzyme